MKNTDGSGHSSGFATDLAYAIGSGALKEVDPTGDLEKIAAHMLLATARSHPMLRHVIDGRPLITLEGLVAALYALVAKGTLTPDGFTAPAPLELGRWN